MSRHGGRIILSLSDNKSYAVRNGTNLYFVQLRAAYKDVKDGVETPYLLFAFVTLCAATLEYSLNYLILEYCIDKYGPHNYKQYCEIFINFQFKNKLYLVPTLLSDGKLVVDNSNGSIKKLEELIVLRNRILHNKESLEAIETPDLGTSIIDNGVFVPVENAEVNLSFSLKDNPIETLSKQLCMQFGDALGDFRTYIMTPAFEDSLVECSLLKLCSW